MPTIRPDDYVQVSGENENEQLYQADGVTVTPWRSLARVR
jgi:hypothetical protein